MKREPHSKYPNGIVNWELKVTWNDGEVEVMSASLHESLRNEIEQHLVDLEDLRAQDPDNYFEGAAEVTDAQLQMLADDLIAKYKHEIVRDGDWWHGTDEYSFNIHTMDDDDSDWYNVNVYKVDPVTGMDNYEWMIDLPRVFIKGEKA